MHHYQCAWLAVETSIKALMAAVVKMYLWSRNVQEHGKSISRCICLSQKPRSLKVQAWTAVDLHIMLSDGGHVCIWGTSSRSLSISEWPIDRCSILYPPLRVLPMFSVAVAHCSRVFTARRCIFSSVDGWKNIEGGQDKFLYTWGLLCQYITASVRSVRFCWILSLTPLWRMKKIWCVNMSLKTNITQETNVSFT